jgi:hypothetical protein
MRISPPGIDASGYPSELLLAEKTGSVLELPGQVMSTFYNRAGQALVPVLERIDA